MWTPSQRYVLMGLIVIAAAYLGWISFRHRAFIPRPQPAVGDRASELANKLDLNTAKWEELAILPGMGENKARAIVDYRADFMAHHGGERAFESVADLKRIKGFGKSTVSNLEPYLIIAAPAATQP
jgi:competence ComEA-like helix-hairpin-helix protein